jgi:hypothetical protein
MRMHAADCPAPYGVAACRCLPNVVDEAREISEDDWRYLLERQLTGQPGGIVVFQTIPPEDPRVNNLREMCDL